MNEFEKFISRLSDHELAIFVKYRYDGFLAGSKEKIDKELKHRKLSADKLENYLKGKLNLNGGEDARKCLRCGSGKLFSETSYQEIPFNEFSSLEVASETHRCRLCGFNADKEEPKNFMDRIKRVLGSFRGKRISKWNSV